MIIPVVETLSNSTTILAFKSSTCNDLHSCRTIWNIIWSSLFTLFACVWLSVHPNIPAPDESWGRRGTRRVWMMIVALLVPEFLVGWAMRQRIVASDIAKENKKYGWTKTHGFFVVMGGFMKCDKDGLPDHTVSFDEVDTIPKKTKMRILEEQINDKSKGNTLSKFFAILQTTWFILQCISRTVEDLPVTELEIATTAFCVLNFATYVLWWNKPLNVNSPVRIYADREMTEEAEEGTEAEAEAEAEVAEKEGWIDTCRSAWKIFKQGLVDIPKEIYRPIAALAEEDGGFAPIVFPISLMDIILSGKSYKSNPRRVGTFGPRYIDTESNLFASVAVGTVFGAIHCTAWASQFPSHTEQLLWRVAAISVTTVPLFITAALWAVNQVDSRLVLNFLNYFIFIPACVLYVFARLTLLILPLMSLRLLPPGAFNSVNWIRFIPHI